MSDCQILTRVRTIYNQTKRSGVNFCTVADRRRAGSVDNRVFQGSDALSTERESQLVRYAISLAVCEYDEGDRNDLPLRVTNKFLPTPYEEELVTTYTDAILEYLREEQRLHDERENAGNPSADSMQRAAGFVREQYANRDGTCSPNDEVGIQVNDRDVRFVALDSVKALSLKNTPPEYFTRSGELVRIKQVVDESGSTEWKTEFLGEKNLPGVLHRAASYYERHVTKNRATGQSEVVDTPANVSLRVVDDIIYNYYYVVKDCKERGYDVQIPPLERVVFVPQIAINGDVYYNEGYIPELRAYYKKIHGFEMEPLPEVVTKKDVGWAKRMIRSSVQEFPFVTTPDMINHYAGTLNGLIPHLINGNLKTHLTDKPSSRTGASKLDELTSILIYGYISKIPDPEDEKTLDKKIETQLIGNSAAIFFDNLKRMYKTSMFLSVATGGGGFMQIRVFGRNDKEIRVSAKVPTYINGIHLEPDDETLARLLPTRLDSEDESPADRTGFKHSPIDQWFFDNRGNILRAYLILVKFWIQEGRPKPAGKTPKGIGGFEEWYNVIGGIFDCCHMRGLLENIEDFSEKEDRNVQFSKFLHAWYKHYPHYAPLANRDGLTVNDIGNLIYRAKTNLETNQDFDHADAIMNTIPHELRENTVTATKEDIFPKISTYLRNRSGKIYTIHEDSIQTGISIIDNHMESDDDDPKTVARKLRKKEKRNRWLKRHENSGKMTGMRLIKNGNINGETDRFGWNKLPVGIKVELKQKYHQYRLEYTSNSHRDNTWKVIRVGEQNNEDGSSERVVQRWNPLKVEQYRKKKLEIAQFLKSDYNKWCYPKLLDELAP